MHPNTVVKLRGMTWDHERGCSPLIAVTKQFQQLYPAFEIVWDRRSLKDFGDYPVDALAREYDIILIDHPHVGISSSQGVLVPLEQYLPAEFLHEQHANSVGSSCMSYNWNGSQWALAIDAAAQVASFRPDLLEEKDVPGTWTQLLDLALALPEDRKVGWPLCPTDAMCSFLSLCAGIGGPDFFNEELGIGQDVGAAAIAQLLKLLPHLHGASLFSNPIQMYDRMSTCDEIIYMPLAFGYTNYARHTLNRRLLAFTNIPAVDGEPRGSLLGGVGMAVSAFSRYIPQAVKFAEFAASSRIQKTTYVDNSGQPGHLAAWKDEGSNRTCGHFFQNTLRTLELSYMRPRNSAFPAFQEQAGIILHTALLEAQAGCMIDETEPVATMNRLYLGLRQ